MLNSASNIVSSVEEDPESVQDDSKIDLEAEDNKKVSCPASGDIEEINLCNGYLYAMLSVNEYQVLGLVDTGASRNIMSQDFVTKLKKNGTLVNIKPSLVKLNSAEGRQLNVYGEIDRLPIKLNGHLSTTVNVVVANTKQEVILGSEFLNRSKAKIDYGNLTMCFDNSCVPLLLLKQGNKKGKVCTIFDKTIGKKAVLSCSVEGADLQFPGTYKYTPNKTL